MGSPVKTASPSIYVFETSVQTELQIQGLQFALNRLVGRNGDWNFDLEDCDNILRVESEEIEEEQILRLFRAYGFKCKVLE